METAASCRSPAPTRGVAEARRAGVEGGRAKGRLFATGGGETGPPFIFSLKKHTLLKKTFTILYGFLAFFIDMHYSLKSLFFLK
jgi:hypothetical protein